MLFKIILCILMILFIISSIIYYIYNYKRLFIIRSPIYLGSYELLKDESSKKKKDKNDQIDEHNSYYDKDFSSIKKTFKHKKLNRYHNDYNYSYTFFIKINNMEYRYNKIKEVFSKGNNIYKNNYSKDMTKLDALKGLERLKELKGLNDINGLEDLKKLLGIGSTDVVEGLENQYGQENTENEYESNAHNPRVMIAKDTNDLIISISTYGKNETFIIDNIPLQSWAFIGIVLHNKTLDVYVNGILYNSYTLNNIPVPTEHTIHYGNHGGFDGSLNKLVYYFRALSSLEILDLFNKQKSSLNNSIDTKQLTIDRMGIDKVKKEIDSCYV